MKLNFCGDKRTVRKGKKLGAKKQKEGSTGFISTPNTRKTFGARSHVAISHLSCFNCEHSCWLLLSQAGICAEQSNSYMLLHHVLTMKKVNVPKVLKDSLCL